MWAIGRGDWPIRGRFGVNSWRCERTAESRYSSFSVGRHPAALAEWREAIRLSPDRVAALNITAWVLAANSDPAIRNGEEAVQLAERAAQITGRKDPAVLDTLAAAYADAGRFPEASETARRAFSLAQAQQNPALAEKIAARLRLYEAGIPYRDP